MTKLRIIFQNMKIISMPEVESFQVILLKKSRNIKPILSIKKLFERSVVDQLVMKVSSLSWKPKFYCSLHKPATEIFPQSVESRRCIDIPSVNDSN
jgi:hypothetical protein